MIKNIKSGLVIEKELLKEIEPVLKKWIKTVTKYSDTLEDQCYWYNERANISILSAAAWRTSGWLALEEYTTYKHGEEKGVSKYGRCDLFLTTEDQETSFAIEAKQVWQNIGDRANSPFATSKKLFKEAQKDARNLNKLEAEARLGICFIVPILPKSLLLKDNSKSLEKRLLEWIQQIEKELNPDAIAWCFPKNNEKQNILDGKVYPGVCMVIKHCLRANKIPAKKVS